MAMLAEPRRRKRYNLCPRGKALYEDENRFGTKMLEKMGWTKGSGLGANLSGEKDFVRIRFKNDAEGLGFEQRDDQWTVHEDGFNGLLKSLNGDDSGAKDKEPESEEEARPMGFGFKAVEPEEPSKKKLKENTSGMSLEERSKQSRARVHYKKFTRGKDLAQYSEKDLANIFGKKATEDVEKYPEPVLAVQPKEPKEENPNFAGVQTIITGLSTTDYFKQKMEAMKNKLKKGSGFQVEDNNEAQTNGHDEKLQQTLAENGEVPTKKKKKKKDKERTEESPIAEEELVEVAPKPKKKKKSKRSSLDETEQSEEKLVENGEQTNESPTVVEEIEQDASKLKKKKKSKRSSQDETQQAENSFVEEKLVDTEEKIDESMLKKKKKSKKVTLDESEKSENIGVESEEITEQSDSTSSKKKKSKKKEEATEEVQINEQTEGSDQKRKRKSEKNKETAEDSVEEPAAKKKKKSKKTDDVIIIDDDLQGTNESEAANENSSKKKSKSNNSEEASQTQKKITIDLTTKKKKKSKEEKKGTDTDEKDSVETPPPASEASQTQEKITIDLTDEASSKKKKKSKEEKKSRDTDEKDSVETPPASNATAKKSKRTTKFNASSEPMGKLEITSLALAVEAAVGNRKDSGEKDGNDVSAEDNISGDKSVQSADEPLPKNLLSLKEIQEQLKSFNYFNISKFCADQFYLFDLSAFNNSTLGEIAGYGISENVELNVVNLPSDEMRIQNLWNNKAVKTTKSKKHIRYPRNVQRTSIRAIKKRVAFQGI
ncbi:G patch domain-containing protein 4 isoform X1 [Drosophila santomea]|uniref:G patch domain-containing protein 4 isoform X1 n=1 Tax=Drosophila santomea TaxID=129105 RepID=UPI0019549B57|nr:G patch domain-containing protein 4 isoform X1 [Drosophila santomea]